MSIEEYARNQEILNNLKFNLQELEQEAHILSKRTFMIEEQIRKHRKLIEDIESGKF